MSFCHSGGTKGKSRISLAFSKDSRSLSNTMRLGARTRKCLLYLTPLLVPKTLFRYCQTVASSMTIVLPEPVAILNPYLGQVLHEGSGGIRDKLKPLASF